MDAYQFGSVPERTPTLAPVSDAEIAAAWNAMAAKNKGYKQIAKMTSERLGRLHERIAEHGAEAIIETIRVLPSMPAESMKKASFDDLLKPETCAVMVLAACGETAGQVAGEEPA